MPFLDLVQQPPHTAAFSSQDSQPEQHKKNPLKDGEKESDDTQNQKAEARRDLAHSPQGVRRLGRYLARLLVVHSDGSYPAAVVFGNSMRSATTSSCAWTVGVSVWTPMRAGKSSRGIGDLIPHRRSNYDLQLSTSGGRRVMLGEHQTASSRKRDRLNGCGNL